MLGYGYGYGSPFYMFWDPTYVLILIGVVLSLIASAMVRRNFARYSVVRSASGLTGAQVAQRILSYAGINDVTVCHISGNLTDHYNPRTKQIGLSDSVYGSNSVAAIAVAAHECGHVIQHANSYRKARPVPSVAICPLSTISFNMRPAVDWLTSSSAAPVVKLMWVPPSLLY